MTTEKTIEQKLLAISNQIHNIQKDSTNSYHKYDYVSANKLFEKIKPMLAEEGLIVFPTCTSCAESNGLTTVLMNYRLVNTDNAEVQDFIIPGQGQDKGDKGVYKAMTGAMKYFLLQLFMISTDDDPETDNEERKERSTVSRTSQKESDRSPRTGQVSAGRNKPLLASGKGETTETEENPWPWVIEHKENIYCGRRLFEVPLDELREMSQEFDEIFTKDDAKYARSALSRTWIKEREKAINRWRDSQKSTGIDQSEADLPEWLK